MDSNKFKKQMNVVWKATKKDLNKAVKEITVLLKSGEEHLKDFSEKGKDKFEGLVLSLEREKLYHDLGKATTSSRKSQNKYTKKELAVLKKISKINTKMTTLAKAEKK